MLAGYEKRKAEYENRIREWLCKENLEKFKGKSFDEITAELGNDWLPIGEVPVEAMEFFGVSDPRVYSGQVYFIHHAVARHSNLTVEDYINMIETLSDYDNIYIDNNSEDVRLVFSKQDGEKYSRCVIGKNLVADKLLIYISYYKPDRNKDSKKEILASRVVGTHPSGLIQEDSAAVSISSLRDAFIQTVSSEE